MRITFEENQRRAATRYLTTLLQDLNGNVSMAAQVSGTHRQSFYRLLRRYEIHLDVICPERRAHNVGNEAWRAMQ